MNRSISPALLLLLLILLVPSAHAQHAVTARVVDAHEGTPLPGVNVAVVGSSLGAITDADGLVRLVEVPAGQQTLRFSFVGYATEERTFTFPLADPDELIEVRMEEKAHELDEATVTATRTSRSIADTPTRVETIGGEEIEEKIAMDPSSISMMLMESPGIVVQQTSSVSASSGFQIQGLDGRYTQLMRDGFPLYGGLGGGLSILQIPPLDLQQVEVIKGPVSTLYGGDAIAGLINLVSKRPTEEEERSILLNGTSAGGVDGGLYLAGRDEHFGYTMLATGSLQRPYDAEDDAFTNLPRTRRLTVSPTLYHYGAGTLRVGLSRTAEHREGGFIYAIRDGEDGYVERNESTRYTALVGYELPIRENVRMNLRSSGSLFERSIEIPGFDFEGRQLSSYTEASLASHRGAHDVIIGVDLRTDRFDEEPLDYAHASVGVFAQDVWDLTPTLALETGLRVDLHNEEGMFVLPRANLLVQPVQNLAVRLGGGFGYKAPTPFVEEAEIRAFQWVLPVADSVKAEQSVGGSLDVNYRAALGPIAFSINQAFYLTRLTDPLVPFEAGGDLQFMTGEGNVTNWGSETSLRLMWSDLKLFLGYVYLNAQRHEGGQSFEKPLTAHHRTYSVLVWEQHDRGRIGIEAYYTGPQHLPDGTDSPGYLITGVMGMWRFGPVRAFLNLENFLDARQTRHMPLVDGTLQNPIFPPVWGPTDGFIANGGVVVEF